MFIVFSVQLKIKLHVNLGNINNAKIEKYRVDLASFLAFIDNILLDLASVHLFGVFESFIKII